MGRGGARKGRVRGGGQPAARRPRARARRLGQLEAQPRRARHRSGADPALAARRVGRLARAGRRAGRPVRGRRPGALPRRDLTAEDVENYYEGFSNDTLWPLYHDVVAPPSYHRHWWEAYVRVNERFAEAVDEVARRGRDGLGARLPAPARARPCSANAARTCGSASSCTSRSRRSSCSCSCRGASEIIEGLLGADLVGFHTPGGARNFRTLSTRYAGAASRATAATRLPAAAT